jgi:hypothetical protein
MALIKIFLPTILTFILIAVSNHQADAASSTAAVGQQVVSQSAGKKHNKTDHFHREWFRHKDRLKAEDEPRHDIFATVAMILAVTNLLGALIFFPIVLAPIGIIFSLVAIVRITDHPDKWKGKRKALWAMLLNSIALAVSIWWFNYLSGIYWD